MKKNIIFITVILILLGGLGFCGYKYLELQVEYNKLNNEDKKDDKKEENLEEIKEGYISFDENYKIYALEQHNSTTYSMIIGYNDKLYSIKAGDYGTMCISQIANAKFDDKGNYECKITKDSVGSTIHKFRGKESELLKARFSIWHSSTDGSKYPILIYKTGTIESTEKETEKALKEYQIKDFISEECTEREQDSMVCKKVQYKVVLQDGTEKIIEK